MPLIIVMILTKFFGKNKSIKEGLAIWPYALFAGACFIIPYLITAFLLGPEFPSLIGGLISLIILMFTTKAGFLVPKEVWDFPEKSNWEKNWTGSISMTSTQKISVDISTVKAWSPYILIGLLVIARVDFLPFNSWLKAIKISSSQLFGTNISTEFEFLAMLALCHLLSLHCYAFHYSE